MKKTLMLKGLITLMVAVCLIMTGCLDKGEDGPGLDSIFEVPDISDDLWEGLGLISNKLVITNASGISMPGGTPSTYTFSTIIDKLSVVAAGDNGFHTFIVALYPAGSLIGEVTEDFLRDGWIAAGDYYKGQMKYRNPDYSISTTLTVSLYDTYELPFNKKGLYDVAFIFDDDNSDYDIIRYRFARDIAVGTTNVGALSSFSNIIIASDEGEE